MNAPIRMIAFAGSIAAGLASTISTVNAQVVGWNEVLPTSCYEYAYSGTNGQLVSNLYVYTSSFTVNLTDPAAINAAMQWCYNGSAFYAYWLGGSWGAYIYVIPGLR